MDPSYSGQTGQNLQGTFPNSLAQPVVMTPGSLSVRGIIWVTRLERINSVESDPAGSSVYERRPNGDVVDRGRAHHRET
jgi:hypothetical protein